MSKKCTGITDAVGNQPQTIEYDVKSGAAGTVKPGMFVKKDGGNDGYVTKSANGDTSMLGIAASLSTDTATADGVVLVYVAPVLKFGAIATTPANLAQTTKTDKVTIDTSSNDHTVDENDTSSGFIQIVEYDNTTDGNCVCLAECTL